MYCNHCGKQIPEDSKFCPECGATLTTNYSKTSINNNINFNVIGDFIVTSIKSPIISISRFIETLTPTFTFIYFAIACIIYSIISSLSIRIITSSSVSAFVDIMAKLEGASVSSAEIFTVRNDINSFISNCFPFKTTFWWFTISCVLFYFIVILLTVIFHTVAYKFKVNLVHYFVVASVAVTVQISLFILTLLCTFISIYLASLLFATSNIITIIILYRGFSLIVKETDSNPYLLALLYSLSSFITSYVLCQIINDHLVRLSPTSILQNIISYF